MPDKQIQPHKVTKPIQLLAAWLVGLIATNAIFLTSAINLDNGSWERSALVVSAIFNVPLFLFALFILQTRFRAELQEDSFYSEYLSKKSETVVRIDKNASQDARLDELEQQLSLIEAQSVSRASNSESKQNGIDWSNWAIALNDLHPRFQAIRQALRAANIPLAEIFGGIQKSNPPSKWIIALSYQLPIAHKTRLLEVLLPFGFDGVQLWEPQREAGESEDVYIGCYGNEIYAPVTPELLDLVQKKIDIADLNYYYEKYVPMSE